MVIYLDVIIGINLICNGMILLLTSKLSRVKLSRSRLLLGTIVASLIVPVTVYFPGTIFTHVGFKFIYSIVIILSTFGYVQLFQMMKRLCVFYFVTFAIGGGLIGIHFILNESIIGVDNMLPQIDDNQVNAIFILIGFPLIWLFTKLRMDSHVGDKIKYDQLYRVNIEMDQQTHQTIAFIDSGNQLKDPVTRVPVIICDEVISKRFFSKEGWKELNNMIKYNMPPESPSNLETQVQLIPYQGAAGNASFLYAIKPDRLIVHYGEQVITTNKVYIGIRLGSLSSDHRFHCLLHPEIIAHATIESVG